MSLAGTRVLIVEDEPIIAMSAEDMLDELGCVVTASVATLAEALKAAEQGGFDLALLDINLNGVASLPVADRLREAGIPFIFATGYGPAGAGSDHPDAPVVAKPYKTETIAAAMAKALSA